MNSSNTQITSKNRKRKRESSLLDAIEGIVQTEVDLKLKASERSKSSREASSLFTLAFRFVFAGFKAPHSENDEG